MGKPETLKSKEEIKMKITRKELRKIIEESFPGDGPGPGYRAMSLPATGAIPPGGQFGLNDPAFRSDEPPRSSISAMERLEIIAQQIETMLRREEMSKKVRGRLNGIVTQIRMHQTSEIK